jgi:hypothetical protein
VRLSEHPQPQQGARAGLSGHPGNHSRGPAVRFSEHPQPQQGARAELSGQPGAQRATRQPQQGPIAGGGRPHLLYSGTAELSRDTRSVRTTFPIAFVGSDFERAHLSGIL